MASSRTPALLFTVLSLLVSLDAFDPDLKTPLEEYAKPKCFDYYDDEIEGDFFEDEGDEESPEPCPGVQDPPRILLMEISTRFFDSLDGGKDVEDVSYGIRSKRGTFFKSGACYEFLSVRNDLKTIEVVNAMNSIFSSNRLNKILFVVDFDIMDDISKSVTIKTQMKILGHLFGQDLFKHMFVILGHQHADSKGPEIKRQAIEALNEELLDPSSPSIADVRLMDGKENFYQRLLNDAGVKKELGGGNIPVAILQEGKVPFLFHAEGELVHDELFMIAGYFSWPESSQWRAEWRIFDRTLWTVERGVFVGQSQARENKVTNVVETIQEVEHISGPLYFAKLWIKVKVGQPEDLPLSLDITSNPPSGTHLRTSINLGISMYGEWESWSPCQPSLKRSRSRRSTDGGKTDTAFENCDHITGLTEPNFCSQHGFVGPRVLLLGATGVGKSTLGNLLFGVNKGGCEKRGRCLRCKKGRCKKNHCLEFDPEDNQCIRCPVGKCPRRGCAERECLKRHNYQLGRAMPSTEPLPFEPGGGIDSKTLVTKPISHQFLGNGPCITLIDTPGAADTKGRDYKHAIEMAKMLKEELQPSTLNIILITFKGTDRRFDVHTLQLLNLYQEIFGKEMWRNVVVEMSYWGHKERDACKRKTDYEPALDEEQQRQDLQEKLRELFGLTFEVPIIFIDPVLKIFHPPHHNKRRSIETREEDIFRNQTSTLWKLANQMPPYECSANCKAPSRFYIGEPWITMGDEAIEEGQVNLEIPCKIWDGIAAGSDKNSDEVRWTFNGEPLLIKDKKRDPIKSHTLLQTYGMEAFPPATTRGSMFAVSKVVIKQANGKKHNGNYTCSNSHGSSSWNLSIPFWAEWESWSSCSKSCKTYPEGQPGIRQRHRECVGHVDEANTCSKIMSGGAQEEPCTGDRGTDDIFCPVPPVATDWSEWSPCSKDCGGGDRGRTMTCVEGKFPVNPGDELCPTPGHQQFVEEREPCNTHVCPVDCKWYPWGRWAACTQTCRTGQKMGTKIRTRKVKVQAKGTGAKCGSNSEESVPCGKFPECPVDGIWSNWTLSGECWNAQGCVDSKTIGKQKWERVCEGQKAGGKLCKTMNNKESSFEVKETNCNDLPPCPIDCKLSEWSTASCHVGCGQTNTVYQTRIIEVQPQHGGRPCGSMKKAHKCYGSACPQTHVSHHHRKCYARSSLVSLASGETILMDDLKVGQLVQVTDLEGKQGTSKFVGWTEKHSSLTEFHQLTTEAGNVLKLTGSHGLFIWKSGSVIATFAQEVSVGDFLVVSQNSNSTQADMVTDTSVITEFGALGPLTESGTIIVNNVSTSCYASYPHNIAHIALLPARWWPEIFLDDEESQEREGTRNYIINIKWLGRIFSPSGFRIDNLYVNSSWSFGGCITLLLSACMIGLPFLAVFQKKTSD